MMYVATFIENHKPAAGKVFSFEPGLTAPLLETNIRANGLENFVTAADNAVYDLDSCLPIVIHTGDSLGSRLSTFPQFEVCSKITKLVPCCRLDTFLRTNSRGDSRQYIFKIDTECFDGEAILGLTNTISKGQVVAVIFEYAIALMQSRRFDAYWPLCLLHENNFAPFNVQNIQTRKNNPYYGSIAA